MIWNGGNGKDIIFNWGNETFINAGDGEYEIGNAGAYGVINSGNDNDRISNGGDFVIINTENGTDRITNTGLTVSISAGEADDTIETSVDNVTVRGGKDNESLNVYDNRSNAVPYIFENETLAPATLIEILSLSSPNPELNPLTSVLPLVAVIAAVALRRIIVADLRGNFVVSHG